MGCFSRPCLIVASLLLAMPVHAQQSDAIGGGLTVPPAGTTPPSDPSRQGPELDVYRDPVTPRSTPPVASPPVQTQRIVPPPVTVQPVPAPAQPRTRPTPQQASPPTREPARQGQPVQPDTPPATAPVDQQPVAPQASGATSDTSPAPSAQPLPPPSPAPDAETSPAPASPAPNEGAPWPWIIAGVIALLVSGWAFIARRRKQQARLRRRPAATRAQRLRPESQAAPEPQPAPTPAPPPAPAPQAPPAVDRPWIDIDMTVVQARLSLIGVTVAYRLSLHNRGNRDAQDILIRGVVGNAGTQQQALLDAFFTGEDGLPLHSLADLAAGETVDVTGDLRLTPDRIVPVDMNGRSLLVPVLAFDIGYDWAGRAEDAGTGRTARAFVVGQEQEPPGERLAPLRLDQGPRQFRRPAARAAAELTPA